MTVELEESNEPGADAVAAPASGPLAKSPRSGGLNAETPDQHALLPTIRVIGESLAVEAAFAERVATFQLPVLVRSASHERETAADVIIVVAPHPESVLRRARAAAARTTHPEVLILGTGAALAARAKQCGLTGPAVRYLSDATLEPALVELIFCALPLRRLTSRLVGRMSLKDVQRHVRTAMLLEALTRASGSRRLAARMLGVTRPAVQQMLATLDLMEIEEDP